MNKYLVLLASIFTCATSLAGEAYLTGEGQVLSSPDYVELMVQVESKCYSTPEEARKANDESARKIVDFLNKKVSGKDYYNKVISQGGYTNPYTTYHNNQVLCENTFQKLNTITFRTSVIENFEALFEEIQKEVYSHFSMQPRGLIEASVTYVTMNNPMPLLSQEKRNTLEQKALHMALLDAKSKLEALFSKDQIKNLKLTQISEIPPEYPRPPIMARGQPPGLMSMAAERADFAAPVQFDDQWISKTVYFKFTFEDVSAE